MLSFIIPAYNEEFELGRSIAAIRAAAKSAGQRYEIIVADDGSTDATPRIARAEGAVLVQIQRRQIAAARNAGAKAATGETLFFVDADTRISAAHIADAIAALTTGCSGGSARVALEGAIPRWARVVVRAFSVVYFANNLGVGAFLFTSRENFERVGGFDERLFVGEEVFFSMALKKIGRFKLLSVPVVTSGRRLRMYSGARLLSRSFAILLRGPRGARNRDNCEFWYDGRRESEPTIAMNHLARARKILSYHRRSAPYEKRQSMD
jgi:glycosyltransferase involved in cell wall biosynthesis